MGAIRAIEHGERSGWWPDLTLILVLVCLYFFSFPPGSPVFGPSELFKQDTIHIKKHLIINKPYRWNPQHHLLYHVMVEGGYSALVHLGLKHNALGVHYYLKGFTASTGLGFLLLLAALMRQLGLTTVRRLVALLFTGVSVTAWFHFSVFETHSLAAIPVILYWLCLFNILRRPEPRSAAYLLLALSLAVAALARFDQFRLLVLTLPLLLLPALKRQRLRLAAAFTLALCLAGLGYMLLGRHYFKAPWAKVPAIIVSRQEFAPLKVKLEHVSNLKPPLLWRMIRATSLYTLLMPLGPRNFRAPLTTIKGRPLAMLAFACLLAFWLALLRHWLPGVWRGDAFLLMLMAHWLATLLFFTWFNPHEPFLWLMYFLPLTTIAAAYCFASQGKVYWLLWGLTAMLLLAHNAVYFYFRFS